MGKTIGKTRGMENIKITVSSSNLEAAETVANALNQLLNNPASPVHAFKATRKNGDMLDRVTEITAVDEADLLQNHYMMAMLLESLDYYPEPIRDTGNRMDFCDKIAKEFTEEYKGTNWDELLWEEELEKFIKVKISELC